MKLREGQFRFVEDGIGFIERRILREMAHFRPLGDRYVSGIDNHLADKDFEECGLAGPVGIDESDSLAAFDIEAKLVEDDALAEGLFDVGESGDGHSRRIGGIDRKVNVTRNPSGTKSETRNQKSEPIPNVQNPKKTIFVGRLALIRILVIGIFFGFRISDFGFSRRISDFHEVSHAIPSARICLGVSRNVAGPGLSSAHAHPGRRKSWTAFWNCMAAS